MKQFFGFYADLSGIVTSIHNDNQKAVINLVISLSDNGSNIKSQLKAFKNQISALFMKLILYV
jgi:hypothetical protein